jgi:hypothetical protein
MATMKIAATAASNVSEATLKLAPGRLLTFLEAVTEPAIRAQFATLGWSDERLDEAWSLLGELKAASVVPVEAAIDPIPEAMRSCEAWQATTLVRMRALLQMSHPEQAAFLFGDIEPGKGTAAVLNAATFLERRRALDKDPRRKDTRTADHEALAMIDETLMAKASIKELEANVATVQSAGDASERLTRPKRDGQRLEALRKIHAWVTAWSEMARTVVTRRDQLIKLGIAKRRAPKSKAPVVTPPAVVAPPVDDERDRDGEFGPTSRVA